MIFDKLYEEKLVELNRKSRAGIISIAERTTQREKIIIENLLKDYTNGVIILE